jgi:transposase
MGVQMAEKRKRRQFTKEFRAEAVRLVRESGKPVSEVARDIDVTETSLYAWVRQDRVDRGYGSPGALTSEELEELRSLRKEVRELRLTDTDRQFYRRTPRRRSGISQLWASRSG